MPPPDDPPACRLPALPADPSCRPVQNYALQSGQITLFLLQWPKARQNYICRPRVKISCRFVRQQQFRRIGQRPGNGYSLLLAARQLCRTMLKTFSSFRRDSSHCAFSRAALNFTPAISCGSITFSVASKSASRL